MCCLLSSVVTAGVVCTKYRSVVKCWASLGVATPWMISLNTSSTEGGYNKAALCWCMQVCVCEDYCAKLTQPNFLSVTGMFLQCFLFLFCQISVGPEVYFLPVIFSLLLVLLVQCSSELPQEDRNENDWAECLMLDIFYITHKGFTCFWL